MWSWITGKAREARDVLVVIGILAVPAAGLAKWAIAQEVAKQQRPIAEYIDKDIQNGRDLVLIAEWESCMRHATGYTGGTERRNRCDLERQHRRDVWRHEDCERENGIGAQVCTRYIPDDLPPRRELP